MELKALNLNYSTKPSIIYIACCEIILMFYNGKAKGSAPIKSAQKLKRVNNLKFMRDGWKNRNYTMAFRKI